MYPELLLLIGISFSLGFAPGPNNAVASYSAFNFGLRKTLPVIWGVGLGYTALVVLLIFVLMSVFEKYPFLIEVIRLLGSLFLIYLAYKISFSESKSKSKTENPVKFYETFFFQFINPKGVIAAITLISKFVKQENFTNTSYKNLTGGIVAIHDVNFEGERYGSPRVLRESGLDWKFISHSAEVGIAYIIKGEE